MGSSYNETHQDILLSAKGNFLKKGFERANLREICKEANVTTGAFYRHFKDKESVFEELVDHVVKKLKRCYFKSEVEFHKTLNGIDNNRIWDMTDESMMVLVEFIYGNYDEFKLILTCADGTKYENFLHDIAKIETINTLKFMDKLKEKGYKIKNISEKEVHVLIQAYFSSIFEGIVHDYHKSEAIKCIKTVVNFNKTGWKYIFGM
ncbi:TetR/AcrR family transcriptional regulator [Clostridium sp.]|uniref:TetR/AcrR family transcriptional regulator n=1 Tax=Clostridium sp. TaxID=1506 RepID=UPI00359F47FD